MFLLLSQSHKFHSLSLPLSLLFASHCQNSLDCRAMSGQKWVMTENDSAGTDPLWTASGWKIAHQCALGRLHLICNTELRRLGQFFGTFWEHPRRIENTHIKREGRREESKEERTFHKHSDLTLQFCQQQVCFSFASSLLQLPSFLSPVSADGMKLEVEEWVHCSVTGSVYYSLCSHENWWLLCLVFPLLLSSSLLFQEICTAANCCDSPVPEDLQPTIM